jgi:hypothetical protein
MESSGALNPLRDFNLVNEVNVIEQDIEDVNDKCNKIQCQPIYNALNAVFKLIIDVFKCFKYIHS